MRVLVIIAILIPILSFAEADCLCPPGDTFAKKNCSVLPKRLDLESFKLDPSTSCIETNPLKNLKDEMLKCTSFSDEKNWKETINYMSCYRNRIVKREKTIMTERQNFCHFKMTLSPLINLAAESTGLPASVEACILNEESRFYSGAKNDETHATGYIQFMPGTTDDIDFVLHNKKKLSDWKNELNVQSPNSTASLLQKELQALAKARKDKKSIIQIQLNINYLNTRLLTLEGRIKAKEAWDRYWEGTEPLPKSMNMESTKCPQMAMIMMMVKQLNDSYLMKTINENMKVSVSSDALSINGFSEQDSAIMLAGSYNKGIGGFAKKCGAVKSLEECLSLFKKNDETRSYMEDIRGCAKKGITTPIHHGEQKKCEEEQCFT